MSVELRLPELGESVTAAKVTVWLKREGDRVAAGEPVVEVETDKTTVEIEAPVDGIIQQIHAAAGTESVPVGALLAVFTASVADINAMPAPQSAEERPCGARSASSTAKQPVETDDNEVSPREVTDADLDRAAATIAIPASDGGTFTVTPLAARMAQIAGLDLATVAASSDGTRITKTDVDRALGRQAASARAPRQPLREAPALDTTRPGTGFRDESLSAMRRVTAARLTQAKQTIPHFYLGVDCRADALVEFRARVNAVDARRPITITDLLLYAVSRALVKVPQANAAWTDSGIRVYDSVDIAVAVNTPGGLIAPVVRECHVKRLPAIASELKDLAERARRGSLKPDEYSGGTFTVSNLGMFGVTTVTPIVNPPQACILGIGGIEPRATVVEGRVAAGRVVNCTLAADHRVLDGAAGATLLAEIRRRVEDPTWMALFE